MRIITSTNRKNLNTKIKIVLEKKINPFKIAVPALVPFLIFTYCLLKSRTIEQPINKVKTEFESKIPIKTVCNIDGTEYSFKKGISEKSEAPNNKRTIEYWQYYYLINKRGIGSLDLAEKYISPRIPEYERITRNISNILNPKTKVLLENSFKKFYEKVSYPCSGNLEDLLLDIANLIETVESHGDSNAISINEKGKILAVGSHQLSPLQAGTYNFNPEDVFHRPYKERGICLKFIRDNVRRFGNTETPLEFALAAYNWGPENVAKIIKITKTNDFWKLIYKYPDALNNETLEYVLRISALLKNNFTERLKLGNKKYASK